MRIGCYIACIVLCVFAFSAKAQISYEYADATSKVLFDAGDWKQMAAFGDSCDKQGVLYYGLCYRAGIANYFLKAYRRAEYFLTLALHRNNTSQEAASYLYGTLLEEGYDLEADKLQRDYPSINAKSAKQLLESFYLEGGVKLPADKAIAKNVSYASAGITSRLKGGVRLWQAVTWMQQLKLNTGFRQYEYFISVPVYAGQYWYIRPSAHWALTDYDVSYPSSTVLDFTETRPGPGGQVNYHTTGTRNYSINVPGKVNSLNIAVNIARRFGAVQAEVELAGHYISDKYDSRYAYTASGTTDSNVNGGLNGSKPYSDAGYGRVDSTERSYIGQLGAVLSYWFPFWNERVSLRAAGFLLFDKSSTDVDFNIYGLFKLNDKCWLHASYMQKGSHPLALNYEGQYFTAGSPTKERLSCSAQLFPLGSFTPFLTYQYEKQLTISQAVINYNAIYLTIKYNL